MKAKPCHSCDGETFIVQHDIGNENWSKIYYSVKCSICGSESAGSTSEKLAIDRWNESKFNVNDQKWRALNREKCRAIHEKWLKSSYEEYEELMKRDEGIPYLQKEWKRRQSEQEEFYKNLMKKRLRDDESGSAIYDWSDR